MGVWGYGGICPERDCGSATGVPKHGNQLHMSLGIGVWGLRKPATVRQVCPNMGTICIYTHAYVLGWGMGPERACDSATGVPIYGNHLHIHPGPCIGMGVWGLREPATVQQVCPNMETICIYTQAHVLAWGYGA